MTRKTASTSRCRRLRIAGIFELMILDIHIGSSTQESRADCCNLLDRKTFFPLQNCKYPAFNSRQWAYFRWTSSNISFNYFFSYFCLALIINSPHPRESSATKNEYDKIEEPHFLMVPKQRMIYKQISSIHAEMWQTIVELILNAVRIDGVKPLNLTLSHEYISTYEFSYFSFYVLHRRLACICSTRLHSRISR